MNLVKRIYRRFNLTYVNFKSDCHFSIYYAVLRLIHEIGGRLHLKRISLAAKNKKDNWILNYLKNEMTTVITDYKNINYQGVFEPNSPIWICWWTGVNSAPQLVKNCINSIFKNSGTHPVIFIDQWNYSEYITIPDYIIDKAKIGKIGLAHLSDYIRVSLLKQYGGLWLDSTIFCSKRINDEYFNIPFFTCKSNIQECNYISKMRWTTFVLGGWKDNILYSFIQSALETYWNQNDTAIDYLFFDYLIEIAYQEIPAIRLLIDKVPINNIHRDDLQLAMNNALPSHDFNIVLTEDTTLYKLSWRETYSLITQNGEQSIYAHFLNYYM